MGDRREKSINPILTRIANARKKKILNHRLRMVTSSVDTGCPKSLLKGRRSNPKKMQMDEGENGSDVFWKAAVVVVVVVVVLLSCFLFSFRLLTPACFLFSFLVAFFFSFFVHLFVRLHYGCKHSFSRPPDRFAHIERENRKLLIQMSNIMLRPKEKNPGSHVQSLNLPMRQRDIKRINYDNRLLLERIEKTQPYCE